tara:strand:- start:33 stop:407 length:375 start_codon:yes stop_codon:yes gene_type:complete
MRYLLTVSAILFLSGCSTMVNDSHVPINLSFSDNSAGECSIRNKRESYETSIPASVTVRRSDDPLVYDCTTSDGRKAEGKINSQIGQTMAGNIILGGGIGAIIDANNDMHREYPGSFVIPVVSK